ncbi:MAG TPA: hypothetical protein VNE39_19800 [Planctomycetota bacterium]|nr:hypothetical protein [Planctomycetota bacterium]
MKTVAVVAGECLSSLADKHGFRNYHSIWDHGANASLRTECPHPNMLLPGKSVAIPDEKTEVAKRAADQTWKFVVKKKRPAKLRIVLVDEKMAAVKGAEWQLASPLSRSGTTGANGLIEIADLPPQARNATLKVTLSAPYVAPAGTPAPATVASPPPYPPPIVPADFTDATPAERDPGGTVINWGLLLGHLPTGSDRSGVQARLHNLAFPCDTDSDDAKTARAVKLYQKLQEKQENGSGQFADIMGKLETLHDNP